MILKKAYELIVRDKKSVPQFCRDLQRTAGVNVRDWVRIIEWHKNGFPHWHIFISDVEIVGKAGKLVMKLFRAIGSMVA